MISLFAAVAAAVIFFWLGRLLVPDEPIILFGGASLIGLMTRSLINKIWSKHHKQTDSSDVFPNLRREALEKWGVKWGKQYKYLDKIVLFDPPLKYPLDVKYILYFDFDTSTPEGKMSEESFNKINAFQDNIILDSGFQEVYRKEPGSRFRDEWFLSIVEYSGFNDKYSWEIYRRKDGPPQQLGKAAKK